MRILVAIASYGTANDAYLSRIVKEYRSMPFDVHIVVLSNIQKEVSPDVELQVGLPSKNPWTLPFPHKKIFAERLEEYDLFIYAEDDILLTRNNIEAFVRVSELLPINAIAGFLRCEKAESGEVLNYPDVHWHFHWKSDSVLSVAEYQFAYFTNVHSACYAVTRDQLRRAIRSGGFLVGPHTGDYDLLCSAATDLYTQCGFQKLICISHLDDFLVSHLSNKYVAVHKNVGAHLGISDSQMRTELKALLQNGENCNCRTDLFETKTKLKGGMYSKEYYEPVRPEIISAIPRGARSLISVGCGWGATEISLAAKGLRVVAVPLDSVTSATPKADGIEVLPPNFDIAREKLRGRQFDCVLFSNVLHLLANPSKVLTSFAELMSPAAGLVIVVPNLSPLVVIHGVARRATNMAHTSLLNTYWSILRGDKSLKCWGEFETIGVHYTSHMKVKSWCDAAALRLVSITYIPERAKKFNARLKDGFLSRVTNTDIIATAVRN